jgi:predicted nucleic acid-binding protein
VSMFVADASVALGWIHSGQRTAKTDELLRMAETGTIVVPVLWFAEISNVLLVLERRKKMTRDERKNGLIRLEKLDVLVDDALESRVFSRVTELAEELGTSVYDAWYLEIAERRGLPLGSQDVAVINGAGKIGVRVL